MRPTVFGAKAIVFYIVVLTAYFASPYTNLFFLLISFLSVLFTLNFVWTERNVRDLRGPAVELPVIPAQSQRELEVTVDVARHAAVQVSVELCLGRKRHVIGTAPLVEGPTKIRCRLPELGRGIHEVTALRLTSSYPLGVIVAGRDLDVSGPLVVYPEPLAESTIDPSGSLRRDDAGETLASSGAGRSETAGLRDYREGDTVRDVHWRASARNTRNLVVREYEPNADRAIDVVFDARCEPEEFELSLRAITRLALMAQDLDQPIYLRSQGLDDAFGAGRNPLMQLWKWLAIAAPKAKTDAPPPDPAIGSDAIALPSALHRLAQEAR